MAPDPGGAPGHPDSLGRWLGSGWPRARSTRSSATWPATWTAPWTALAEAEAAGADLAVFPELTVTGYPPEDLLGRPAFVADNLVAFAAVAAATGACAAVVGYVDVGPRGPPGQRRRPVPGRRGARPLREADAAQLRGLRRAALVRPGHRPGDALRGGRGAGRDDRLRGHVVPGRADGRPGRRRCPAAGQPQRLARTRGAAARSASPCWPTARPRPGAPSSTSTRSAARTSWSSTGRRWWSTAPAGVVASARQFVEEVLVCDLEVDVGPGTADRDGPVGCRPSTRAPAGAASHPVAAVLDPVAEVYEALVLGTRDYLGKNGFTDAVIGLSGGIDSSLVAAVAVDAVGSRPRPRGGHAVPLLERGIGVRRRRRWPPTSASTSTSAPIEAAHRALSDHAGPAARRRAGRASPTRTSRAGSAGCC